MSSIYSADRAAMLGSPLVIEGSTAAAGDQAAGRAPADVYRPHYEVAAGRDS